MNSWTVRRVTVDDAARMRGLRLEMLADTPLAFLEGLDQAAARSHAGYRQRIAQAATGDQVANFIADPSSNGHSSNDPSSNGHSSNGHSSNGPNTNRPNPNRSSGRLIGHAGGVLLPEEPHTTVVFAVYLTPAWRGGKVLAELVDAVAEWSVACGRHELMLEVVTGNNRAVRAYEKLGFEDTGERVPHPVVPVLTELRMRRKI